MTGISDGHSPTYCYIFYLYPSDCWRRTRNSYASRTNEVAFHLVLNVTSTPFDLAFAGCTGAPRKMPMIKHSGTNAEQNLNLCIVLVVTFIHFTLHILKMLQPVHVTEDVLRGRISKR